MSDLASRRSFLGQSLGLGVATAFATKGAAPAMGAEKLSPADGRRKKLIAWGGIDWYSPATVQNNIRMIEELPFDGSVLQGFKTTTEKEYFDWLCFGDRKFNRDDVAPAIETLSHIDYRKFTDNLLRYNVTPGNVDWFDDFSAILHNARLWAGVARECSMKGWAFDVEDYKGTVFNYAKVKYTGEKSFEEYCVQARKRGREFMEAVQDAYPDIVMLLMLSHSYVLYKLGTQPLKPAEYGLMPAFVNGLVEAAGPRINLIDGQEQCYVYQTAEEFYRGYHDVKQRSLTYVPDELQPAYRNRMNVGTAIYVNYLLQLEGAAKGPSQFLSPEDRLQLFEHNIYYAMATTDEYAWCYGERIGWWEPGHPVALPDGALDAIRSARTKIHENQPLGFDMTERVIDARRKQSEAQRK